MAAVGASELGLPHLAKLQTLPVLSMTALVLNDQRIPLFKQVLEADRALVVPLVHRLLLSIALQGLHQGHDAVTDHRYQLFLCQSDAWKSLHATLEVCLAILEHQCLLSLGLLVELFTLFGEEDKLVGAENALISNVQELALLPLIQLLLLLHLPVDQEFEHGVCCRRSCLLCLVQSFGLKLAARCNTSPDCHILWC